MLKYGISHINRGNPTLNICVLLFHRFVIFCLISFGPNNIYFFECLLNTPLMLQLAVWKERAEAWEPGAGGQEEEEEEEEP